jgi:hypothetical protein
MMSLSQAEGKWIDEDDLSTIQVSPEVKGSEGTVFELYLSPTNDTVSNCSQFTAH